ncbi:lipoprotein-releasing system permease protein [Oceanihabitans sediminis]|uniref:ABC transporter permease n=1 Tax=Oceanihabitans sediminis TaxID=1812012 RepID=A0A368P237_9FLAO|nr:FtsX-like permease family protein [Oceanihabitans sediminis]MDX1774742.1 FtsX-like permease family protein [Oceanihabitans sediminis]RBP27647.1 lipoprotein-releasing system permease protein [Oceanihabitans sediminis]RCU56463.1 ABC transporter permease [Oceanihabitans sediminis]
MNFEFFIAKRIIDSKAYKSSVSAPIIKIGIAAIAIGIIVMMIAVATGIGLQQKIRDKVSAFNGHIIISNFDSNNSQESGRPISTQQDFYPTFTSVEGIKNVQAVASKFGIIRTETDFEAIIVKGVGADYNWDYFEEFLIEGRLPDYTKERNQDVLVSQDLAKRMQFDLGDSFTTFFRKEDPNALPTPIRYHIVGIYNSGLKEFDETYVIGDIRHIQRLNKWEANQVGSFEVLLEDYNQLNEKFKEVFQNTSSLLNTYTVEQKHASIFEWISIFDKNTYGIIGIMILVAGINMITALLVLILERTKMIGIFKALGSSNWSIRKMFLYNASYIILIGLFWGNLIGISLLLAQKYGKLFPLDPSVYHVSEVPVYINIGYIVALNIGTFILCLLMLLIPSYIITKISPVKAIRFE